MTDKRAALDLRKEKRVTMKPEKTAPYTRRESLGSSMWFMGNLFTVLADSKETGGRFGLVEILARKGLEPPRHIHHRDDEMFYVLEGGITFYIGDEVYGATPGDFVFAPMGIPHSFTFETDEIRMHAILAPGGAEEMFRNPKFSESARELALPPPPEDPPDVVALAAEMERYGEEIVGPPGAPQ